MLCMMPTRNSSIMISFFYFKSDAFTIHRDDLNTAKCLPNCVMPSLREAVLNFADLISHWRVSKPPINFPNEKYKYKFTQVIEIPTFEKNKLDVADEFDTETICNQIIESHP